MKKTSRRTRREPISLPATNTDSSFTDADAAIVASIINFEGTDYTNDPHDAGGPTKFGITIPVLTLWRGAQATADDVRQLDIHTAGAIYTHLFIRPWDGLIDPLRLNVIDFGVNAGQRRAVVVLQQIIGADVDGVIGPQTREAAKGSHWNPLYVGGRLAFYENLIATKPANDKWRNGWRNRALAFLGTSVVRFPKSMPGEAQFGRTAKAWNDLIVVAA